MRCTLGAVRWDRFNTRGAIATDGSARVGWLGSDLAKLRHEWSVSRHQYLRHKNHAFDISLRAPGIMTVEPSARNAHAERVLSGNTSGVAPDILPGVHFVGHWHGSPLLTEATCPRETCTRVSQSALPESPATRLESGVDGAFSRQLRPLQWRPRTRHVVLWLLLERRQGGGRSATDRVPVTIGDAARAGSGNEFSR